MKAGDSRKPAGWRAVSAVVLLFVSAPVALALQPTGAPAGHTTLPLGWLIPIVAVAAITAVLVFLTQRFVQE